MDNPGNLYGKVRPDNFPNETDYRNPVIAVAMKTLGYVNQFGRGIETVQEELVANKNGLAVFKFDDITTFKVTVMSADAKMENDTESGIDDTENGIDKDRNKANGIDNGIDNGIESGTENDILSLIKENKKISKKNIAKELNIGTTTVSRYIKILRKKNIIERIGSKGGYWKIK